VEKKLSPAAQKKLFGILLPPNDSQIKAKTLRTQLLASWQEERQKVFNAKLNWGIKKICLATISNGSIGGSQINFECQVGARSSHLRSINLPTANKG